MVHRSQSAASHPVPTQVAWSLTETSLVVLGFVTLAVALTYPLAFNLGAITYRPDNGDGHFSIWNTAWVAHALLVNPAGVFDANIFYPHSGTLAYSEANLGSGVLALPVYWLTSNPYASHGFVVLLSFVSSAVGMYALARYLTGDRVAAAVAGVVFAFCPHVFAHLLHIQLLWTAGIPWTLLAFHRLVDRPGPARGVTLGVALAAQLYLCAYYAVFVALVVTAFALALAAERRLWASMRYWAALALGAGTFLLAAWPLLHAYLKFQQETGFARPLGASAGYSADWRAYLASAAYAHAWLLPWLGSWREVLFPGLVGAVLAGIALTPQLRGFSRPRETRALYLSAGLVALWASLGPAAGLYAWLYELFPPFSFMRAPSRFGVVVMAATAILAALGTAHLRRSRRLSVAGCGALALLVVAEHVVPLDFRPVEPVAPAYTALARLPFGALIELPVYSERAQFVRSRYMLASTAHWRPLVNAYSDYIPIRFQSRLDTLGDFPSRESFAMLWSDGVKYALFHLDRFNDHRAEVEERLDAYAPFLALRYSDEHTRLYELVAPTQAQDAVGTVSAVP